MRKDRFNKFPRYPRSAEILARHRREMAWQVYAPLAIAAAVMVIGLAIMALSLSPYKLGTVSAFISLLILVPAVALCIVPYILLVVMAWGVRRVNGWLPSRLKITQTVIHTANEGSYQVARRVVTPIIWLSQRLAWLERFFSPRSPKSYPPTESEL